MPKISLVLADDKHTHNMMQPIPPCLKIFSVDLPKTELFCIQMIKLTSFPKVLQFYFSALLQTGYMFGKFHFVLQASFFSFCLLGYYCGVTAMLLIRPQFSPIGAIKLCYCHKSQLASW
jgi:hypothetical protein